MKRMGTTVLLSAILGFGAVQGASTAWADGAKVTPLMRRELLAAPGKEVDMLTVEYAPGASTPPHRHNAQALVYVLEGTVEMQVKGGGNWRRWVRGRPSMRAHTTCTSSPRTPAKPSPRSFWC
jgi:Cupin domain